MSVLVKRNSSILASALPDGSTALLNPETGRYLTFDETATAIWSRTEEPITFSDLIASLLEEYDVDQAALEKDVKAALLNLADKKVLALAE